MFGLAGPQGNHGEDAKEYWWYLDGLPSHALLRWRYHYPQAAFPYDQLIASRARPRRPGARTAGHRRLRRGSLLVGGRHLRQGLGDRHPDARRRGEPRSGRGHHRRVADAVVSQHLVVGRRRRAPADQRRLQRACRERPPTVRLPARRSAWARRRAAGGTVLRQRDQRSLGCSGRSRRRATRRTASTTTSSTGAADGESGRLRYQSGASVPADRCSWRRGGGPAAPAPAGGCGSGRRGSGAGRFDVRARSSLLGFATPTSSTAALAPAGTSPEEMRVLRQACAGLVWSKQIYPYNVARWFDGDPGQRSTVRRPPSRAQPRLATPGRLRRAGDAGSVGVPVVRRLGSRVSRHRVGTHRSRVRQVSDAGPAAGMVPAPQRGATGLRVELRRRQPARSCDGGAAGVPHRRWAGPRIPRAGLPEAGGQLHLVAQPAGSRRQLSVQRRVSRARQHQPDRPLEPAAGSHVSNRPTAPHGWPSTRCRCWSSRSSWPR